MWPRVVVVLNPAHHTGKHDDDPHHSGDADGDCIEAPHEFEEAELFERERGLGAAHDWPLMPQESREKRSVSTCILSSRNLATALSTYQKNSSSMSSAVSLSPIDR